MNAATIIIPPITTKIINLYFLLNLIEHLYYLLVTLFNLTMA